MLLALDVASSICTVALFDPASDIMLAERVWPTRRRQTEETLPVAAEMLAAVGVDVDSVRTVAVTTGPGSFSGVRIGISVVKGIALGLAQPPCIVGLPALSVIAARFVPAAAAAGALVWPLLQAGRGRFNWAVAPVDDPLWLPPVSEHRAGKVDALFAALQAEECPVWLVGELNDGLRQAAQGLAHVRCIDSAADIDLPGTARREMGEERGESAPLRGETHSFLTPHSSLFTTTRAEGLARLAMRHVRAGSPALTTPLQPLYLLPPQ